MKSHMWSPTEYHAFHIKFIDISGMSTVNTCGIHFFHVSNTDEAQWKPMCFKCDSNQIWNIYFIHQQLFHSVNKIKWQLSDAQCYSQYAITALKLNINQTSLKLQWYINFFKICLVKSLSENCLSIVIWSNLLTRGGTCSLLCWRYLLTGTGSF